MVIWKQWKRIKTKMKNLTSLGVDKARHMNGQIIEKVTGVSLVVSF
jgi:hypothetical protein